MIHEYDSNQRIVVATGFICEEIESCLKDQDVIFLRNPFYTLVQLIFEEDFVLYYNDICGYDWTEIDSINDLLHARKIHTENKKK